MILLNFSGEFEGILRILHTKLSVIGESENADKQAHSSFVIEPS